MSPVRRLLNDYIHNPIDININEVLYGCTTQSGVSAIICSMLSSLRSRIIVLFLLSFLTSGGALLYALSQFVQIGQGLYAINACYLPVSDETTKLDIIVFQLQREDKGWPTGYHLASRNGMKFHRLETHFRILPVVSQIETSG